MPIYRRIPKRGFTNARFRTEYTTINVEALNVFADGDVVDLDAIDQSDFHPDMDGDGYGDPFTATSMCSAPHAGQNVCSPPASHTK